ncbi:MAG: thermonuclease family protein [bacterium]|nr:thermonuclease family protein [bacterium]
MKIIEIKKEIGGWIVVLGIGILLVLLNSGCNEEWKAKQGMLQKSRILMDKSAIRPDDGDSFFYKDIAIRVLGMDTPEITHPEHGIFEDQPYGREAALMTREIFAKAKVIEYLPFRNDSYGRLLAHVFVDGELLSVLLIKAGLAYETVYQYGDNGFPDLAEKIQKAACESGLPPFEPPYKWRRKHQIKP